jgi:hypothetical protein
MKNKEEKLDEFVTDFCWNNLPGDQLWSNDFYRCALGGFEIAEKEIKKQLKDLKNKYSSHLVEHQIPKLTKTINQEEILKLRAKLELIKEIEKKLWHN